MAMKFIKVFGFNIFTMSLKFAVAPEIGNEQEVVLTEEQSRVVELVQAGANIFFTGPAGNELSYIVVL